MLMKARVGDKKDYFLLLRSSAQLSSLRFKMHWRAIHVTWFFGIQGLGSGSRALSYAPGMVAHDFHPSTWETEERRSLWVQCQPGVQSEFVYKQTNKLIHVFYWILEEAGSSALHNVFYVTLIIFTFLYTVLGGNLCFWRCFLLTGVFFRTLHLSFWVWALITNQLVVRIIRGAERHLCHWVISWLLTNTHMTAGPSKPGVF